MNNRPKGGRHDASLARFCPRLSVLTTREELVTKQHQGLYNNNFITKKTQSNPDSSWDLCSQCIYSHSRQFWLRGCMALDTVPFPSSMMDPTRRQSPSRRENVDLEHAIKLLAAHNSLISSPAAIKDFASCTCDIITVDSWSAQLAWMYPQILTN